MIVISHDIRQVDLKAQHQLTDSLQANLDNECAKLQAEIDQQHQTIVKLTERLDESAESRLKSEFEHQLNLQEMVKTHGNIMDQWEQKRSDVDANQQSSKDRMMREKEESQMENKALCLEIAKCQVQHHADLKHADFLNQQHQHFAKLMAERDSCSLVSGKFIAEYGNNSEMQVN